MAKRISSSQLKNQLRQIQNRQRQAVQKYNQDVRRHNQQVKRAVDDYNREVRAYNTRVQRNSQRIKNALAQLQRTPVTQSYTVTLRTSTYVLNDAYVRLEQENRYAEDDPRHFLTMELPQQEVANSLAVTNALLTDEMDDDEHHSDLRATSIIDELSKLSSDLHDRWHGALFSLNPQNPDAARHFCTSSREILTQILHVTAPDESVFAALPNCQRDDHDRPTRRARIQFLLHRKGLPGDALEQFIDNDIKNVLDLFNVFNEGTHGAAGKFDLPHLLTVKRRVEDAIIFVTGIAS